MNTLTKPNPLFIKTIEFSDWLLQYEQRKGPVYVVDGENRSKLKGIHINLQFVGDRSASATGKILSNPEWQFPLRQALHWLCSDWVFYRS